MKEDQQLCKGRADFLASKFFNVNFVTPEDNRFYRPLGGKNEYE